MLQPFQNDEGFVGAIIGVLPARADNGVKKIRQYPVRLGCASEGFQQTSALKFGQTIEFVKGKSLQEATYPKACSRVGASKERANKRGSGGNNRQAFISMSAIRSALLLLSKSSRGESKQT